MPKPDLSRILTEMNRRFMAQRWLLVVSGLTDEEREALGVDYKSGEVLDKRALPSWWSWATSCWTSTRRCARDTR